MIHDAAGIGRIADHDAAGSGGSRITTLRVGRIMACALSTPGLSLRSILGSALRQATPQRHVISNSQRRWDQ